MGVQEIVTYLVVFACVLWVGRHIFNILNRPKKNDNPCAHCASGCDLKRKLQEKQKECGTQAKEKKKS